MAYTQGNNFLNFFTPSMNISGSNTKPLASINIAAANGTHGEFICTVPCVVRRAQATVTLATVSTTTVPVITLKKYTLPNAGGTATTVAALSIPDSSTVGQTLYKDNLSTSFLVGQVVQVSWTLGTGGSVAGEAVVSFNCEHSPEVPANESLMIVSA